MVTPFVNPAASDFGTAIHTSEHAALATAVNVLEQSGTSGMLVAADFLFVEQPTAGESYAITAVDDVAQTYGIAGDHVDEFIVCDWFAVTGHGDDSFPHEVEAVSYDVGPDTTTITTRDGVLDATVSGNIWPSSYRATMNLPAGTTIEDVRLYPITGPWAATQATLFVFDSSPGSYGPNRNDLTTQHPYDPRHVTTANYGGQVGGDFDPSNFATGPGHGGGVFHDTDATLYLTIAAGNDSEPVVPAGSCRVRIVYRQPVIATESSHP